MHEMTVLPSIYLGPIGLFFGKKKLGALLSVVLDLHWADGGPYLDPLLHKKSDLVVDNSIELPNLDKFWLNSIKHLV